MRMNAPERTALQDVQSRTDTRNLRIDAVGIRGLRYPLTIEAGTGRVSTVATWSLSVALEASAKGTHMSRFVELLEAQREPLNAECFRRLVAGMLERLHAGSGTIEVRFPYFLQKVAPVSGVRSLLDYEVCWRGTVSERGSYSFWITVRVPATSAELLGEVTIEELIRFAEEAASCELYGLLKRSDEKYVTERAYDNPRFVEDLVREVALALGRDKRVGRYTVEAENFESIHNHSAFARITSDAAR
jgi:GTP cyclohydrolase IB